MYDCYELINFLVIEEYTWMIIDTTLIGLSLTFFFLASFTNPGYL